MHNNWQKAISTHLLTFEGQGAWLELCDHFF